jgi:phosphoribosylformimino-5-aminoimidazole carboxamide ribotide isomerase
MKIYPAIDIRDGKVVRLKQGRFEDMTVYADDPLEVARDFERQGARLLHVVDLDAAKAGFPIQLRTLEALARGTSLEIQAGGGIRSLDDAARVLEFGMDRVVIGSLAVMQPKIFKKILKALGADRVTLGLDLQADEDGTFYVAISGWQEQSRIKAADLLDPLLDEGLQQVLCTDIARDGMLEGPNHSLYQYLANTYPSLSFLASGGVRNASDLRTLQRDGAGGAIIGRALYEGRLSLEEALQCLPNG